MGLVSRLHDGELECHSLKTLLQQSQVKLHQTQSECQHLSEACKTVGELGERVEGLEKELKVSIPTEKYEEVCRDLQITLQREREMQVALGQHTASIQQLQGRYMYRYEHS